MTYRLHICLCLSFFFALIASATAGDPPISVEKMAELLNYPAERISVADSTEIGNRIATRKNRNTVLSSHVYTAPDNTFAPVTITIGKKGMILTTELRDYAENGLALEGTTISKLSFPNAGSGYFGLGMIGPGGSDEQLTMTLPELGRDLQITITLPGATPLKPVAGYENCLEIANSRAKMQKVVNECAKMVLNSLFQVRSDASIQGSHPNANEHMPSDASPVQLTPPSEANSSVVPQWQNRIWPWVAGALVLTLVAWAVSKYRS